AGVEFAFVTLHVGLDTFRPVHGEDPTEHKIHTEYYELPAQTAAKLNQARSQGRRIIAVGTTSVRVLEQVGRDQLAQGNPQQLSPASGQADLFILPGHRFSLVEAMITNFHLPRSTLLMLVSAFAGREFILRAYQEAIEENYRFYSFGDATLID
ncbi:MAG: S-adenosylmethionine:tRNA ribosyltransferase-isomerase, partial [Dehalococcoidia bacterium]